MPVINLDVHTLTRDQKQELVQRLTATVADVTKIPPAFITVILREHEAINLGVGGESLEIIQSRQGHPEGGKA